MFKKLVIASLVILPLTGCSTVHDTEALGTVTRSSNPAVVSQIEYAKSYYKNPNKEIFGDLGGTDCVNFVSQTLLARGWNLNRDWTYKDGYSRAWISSTGFRDYLRTHPEIATEVTWDQRTEVQVGDVAQFDWDNSGDRDHTAIVSGFNDQGEILLSSHSPAAFDWSITELLAENDDRTVVYFWQIK
jgi:hypothetical protein